MREKRDRMREKEKEGLMNSEGKSERKSKGGNVRVSRNRKDA